MRVGWKVHDFISVVDDFFNQVGSNWFANCKGDYVEKCTSFGHIPWEYLDQLVNFFSASLTISSLTLNICSFSVAD